MRNHRFCTCRDCKRARRKGLVLGSRKLGNFFRGVFGFARVSDYVPHHKFQPGRRPDPQFDRRDPNRDY